MASGNQVEILNAADSEQLMAVSKAEVMTQVEVANKFPRSVKQSIQNALTLATLDEETAQSCFYKVPMAGSFIEGPSIRLAEIMLSAWRNTMVGAKVIGDTGNHVVAQSFCWDMETNVKVGIEYQQKVTNKKGERFSPDVVTNLTNAAVSKAMRNAVFRVVPRSYVNKVEKECRRVAVGDSRTLAENRKRWLGWFAKSGITEERVLAKLGKQGIDDIDLADLEILMGTATALREGAVKLDDVFPADLAEGTHNFGKKKESQKKPAQNGNTKKTSQPKKEAAPRQQAKKPEAAPKQKQKQKADDVCCFNCGAWCPVNAVMCHDCGERMNQQSNRQRQDVDMQVCPHCNADCPSKAKACHSCGKAMDAPPTFDDPPLPDDDDAQTGFGFE